MQQQQQQQQQKQQQQQHQQQQKQNFINKVLIKSVFIKECCSFPL